ncbi:MAG: hypothetical protein JXE07_01330 [Candidatus Aminicenantes bacterium]|nr:hypothetical protein [Candidatus Aminicenantes bacterium]
MDKTRGPRIRFLQHFFYIAFVVLWFKDNFAPLRNVPVHYLFALLPGLGLTAWRSLPRIRRLRFSLPRKIPAETAALLALLLLAVVFRIPYLASPAGLMTSDDAVPALMGKHIAEGRTPAICYYGQLYMGSLSSHFYALAFRIFGYSMFVLKCSTLLIYLAFMIVQFFFLKEVFSFSMALAVGFFLSLPFNPLVHAGLDNTSAYALVLLLGSLLLYLAHLVGFRSRDQFLPLLGLAVGLAFWTHQITAAFILTSFLIVVPRTGWNIRKFAVLGYWAFLGFLPQFLAEVFFGFKLVPFLTHGKRLVNADKFGAALDFTGKLLSPSRHPARYVFLVFVLAGFIAILARAWKSRISRPQTVFCLFPSVYVVLYVVSDFSNTGVVRYLFPLYAALPVLLLAGFHSLKPKLRTIASLAVIIVLFLAFNLKDSLGLMDAAKERHRRIDEVVSAVKETGRRHWMAEYWTAYLLTAVSGERLIVDSYTIQRYLPYNLSYWNSPEKDNSIFLFRNEPEERAHYDLFRRWQDATGFRAETREAGNGRLVFDIEPRIFRRILYMDPPSEIPELELDRIESEGGYMNLFFQNRNPGTVDLGFWLTVEIPGFSGRKTWFSLMQPEVSVTVPHPDQDSFGIRHYVDYIGVKIPSSEREEWVSLPGDAARERTDPVVYLQGIRPETPPGKEPRMICERASSFEFRSAAPIQRLRLALDSPFEFRSWRWYGKYAQTVHIEVNGRAVAERRLKDGRNIVDVPVPSDILKPGANIVNMKFRYERWFPPWPLWPFAAFLNKVELID